MNKLLLFLIIIVCGYGVQGQNLVPNCSFEDVSHCPESQLGGIGGCKDWFSAGAYPSTPDYFTNCDGYFMEPYNSMGFQFAATGKSYAGIAPWIKDSTYNVVKEFIGTKLITPLAIGQRYFVSFKVSFTVNIASDYASSKTGILFSTVKYDNAKPAPIKNFAHIYTNKIITDSTNWTTISGWFTADSAYQYISIGDFFDNAHTDTIKFYNSPYWADISYYYIDDVCVSLDSTKCSCDSGDYVKENSPKLLILAYYNMESKKITVEDFLPLNDKSVIRIFDITGRLLYKSILQNEFDEITTDNFSRGIYIISIKSNQALYNLKLFIN